jgi:hypothetical protein
MMAVDARLYGVERTKDVRTLERANSSREKEKTEVIGGKKHRCQKWAGVE